MKIKIYTDGSSLNNPGKGGYACRIKYGNCNQILTEGYNNTTNNRMELLSVISAISKSNCSKVVIYTDSMYVINPIKKGWLAIWEKSGFKKIKNKDLWLKYIEVTKNKTIEFKWVKSKSVSENRLCDKLAKKAAQNNFLIEDVRD